MHQRAGCVFAVFFHEDIITLRHGGFTAGHIVSIGRYVIDQVIFHHILDPVFTEQTLLADKQAAVDLHTDAVPVPKVFNAFDI